MTTFLVLRVKENYKKLKEDLKMSKVTEEKIETTDLNLNDQFKGFYGTENYYKHFGGVLTDGIKAMAERFKAFWLIDVVFSYQNKKNNLIPFQVWEITSTGEKATVEMKEDTNKPILVSQKIGFTDFPEGKLKMYLIDNVLLLPSEY